MCHDDVHSTVSSKGIYRNNKDMQAAKSPAFKHAHQVP